MTGDDSGDDDDGDVDDIVEQLGRPRRPRRRDQAAGWSVLELSIMANLQSSEILNEVRGESLERGSKRRP
jgi:hypothetical protein